MKIFGFELVSSQTISRMQESIADMDRQLDDLGWVNINSRGQTTQEQVKESYVQMVKRCRLAYAKNPLVAQAVHITTWYTFGEGVQTPKAGEEAPDLQQLIDDFWSNPDNRIALTSPDSQIKLSNKLQYDGELAFALQVNRATGECFVRLLDPLTLDVVFDKIDAMRPAFYKRADSGKTGGFEYFPDISNGAYMLGDPTAMSASLEAAGVKPGSKVHDEVFVFHVKTNNDILDKRGVPEVWRALDWINSNAKINGDMASFINAQSQYAMKKTVKGTKAQVQTQAARIRQNPDMLNNPSKQAGSTIVQNDLIDTNPIGLPSSTGQVFETGIRRTLLMVCAAFGIMEHYFGDPSTGNLATTTAMELPMLKKFLARQKLWEEIILTILNFRIDMDRIAQGEDEYDAVNNRYVRAENNRPIDIDFPPIIAQDLEKTANALSKAKSDALMPVDTCQRMFMGAAGVNNIDEEMEKEFQEPMVPAFGAQPFGDGKDPNADPPAKESVKREGSSWFVYSKAGKKLGGPYNNKSAAEKRLAQVEHFKNMREVVLPNVVSPKKDAVKLADKNRQVLSSMKKYLAEIAAAYKDLNSKALGKMLVTEFSGRYKVKIPKSAEMVRNFADGMNNAAKVWLPKAAALGFQYVHSRGAATSGRVMESRAEDFVVQQEAWNRYYVESSLLPALRRKLREVEMDDFADEDAAIKAVAGAMESMQARVAMYAAAFWTVEERAVKEAAAGSGMMANFVGVNDSKNCAGCDAAIEGNPWPIDEIPQPGEQDCLGACRHAIQLVGDDDLTESDIKILKESEDEYKKGIPLLLMELG